MRSGSAASHPLWERGADGGHPGGTERSPTGDASFSVFIIKSRRGG